MEDDQLGEESKASSEEIVRSDGVDDDFGHGQSYECVFCKRGFSTAQALGGHMNIHRRDRASMRQPRTVTNPSRAIEEDQPITRAHHEVFPYPNCIFPDSLDSSRNHHHTHQLVPPNSIHITRESHTSNPLDMLNSQCLDYYRDDHLCLRLGNQVSYDHTRLWVGDQQRNRQDEEDGDELDLELRLGHYP